MTDFVDIFGTDEFYAYFNNPGSRISDYVTYLNNNAVGEMENQCNVDILVQGYDEVVQVDKCDDGESSGNDGCNNGNNLCIRMKEADNWLESNSDIYDSSSCCLVLDHYNNTDYFASNQTLGCAYGNTWNNSADKTAMVNEKASASWDGFSSRWVAGHEIGHVAGAEHSEVDNFTDGNGNREGTYMHTGASVSGGNCSNAKSVDEVLDYYSFCASIC